MPWTCAISLHLRFDSAALKATETILLTSTKAIQGHGALEVVDKFKLTSKNTVETFFFFFKKHHLLREQLFTAQIKFEWF